MGGCVDADTCGGGGGTPPGPLATGGGGGGRDAIMCERPLDAVTARLGAHGERRGRERNDDGLGKPTQIPNTKKDNYCTVQ